MRRPSRARGRGAALLLVLWLLVLLTGLVAVFALTARTESLQGRFLARAAAARLVAEAGIEVAATHLQGVDPSQRWIPDGREYRFAFEGYQVSVSILDESAKVDLNAAAPDLLTALMLAVGAEQAQARELTGAIMDWRDTDDLLNAEGGAEDPQYESAGLPYGAKDRPFETVSELRLVLGMDAALYARLLPHVTVYSGQGRPQPTFASQLVLQALGLPAAQIAEILALREQVAAGLPEASQSGSLAAQGTGTYSISSLATRADGTRVRIHSAIRIGSGGGFGKLYLPLSWHVGEFD